MNFLSNYMSNKISDRAAFWATFFGVFVSLTILLTWVYGNSLDWKFNSLFLIGSDYPMVIVPELFIITCSIILGKIVQLGTKQDNKTTF